MRGLHIHVGSQIVAVEPFAAGRRADAALGEFPVYDLGGGLGARYSYATVRRRRRLPRALAAPPASTCRRGRADRRARSQHGGRGRGDAVPRPDRQAGDREFVAVDGGMGDDLEVALYGQRFEAAWPTGDEDQTEGDGGRRHCESGDVLVDGVAMARRVGDLLAIPATGAYCYTMANDCNGAPASPWCSSGDGASLLVVRRETWADLLARDVDEDRCGS